LSTPLIIIISSTDCNYYILLILSLLIIILWNLTGNEIGSSDYGIWFGSVFADGSKIIENVVTTSTKRLATTMHKWIYNIIYHTLL